MIYYTSFKSKSFGDIFLAKSEKGICAVSIAEIPENFIRYLQQHFDEGINRNDQQLAGIVQQLVEYFEGKRQKFQITIDWSCIPSSFDRKVLQELFYIPFGQLVSYQELARLAGKAKAARAVGNALGRNPMSIIIPCHRVIRKDGSLGGYTGGLEIKRRLLELEGLHF